MTLSIVMLSVIFAESHIQALYAECHYAQCHYAECRGSSHPDVMQDKS